MIHLVGFSSTGPGMTSWPPVLFERAEQAGYSAIVVTLDTYLLAWRERDIRNAYLPFFHGDGLANYVSDPVFRKAVGGDLQSKPARVLEYFGEIFSDPSRTWEDLARLCQSTRLPVVAKGILRADDARRAVDKGAAGVIVSNHGGRQLDGAIAALDALPHVASAVGDQTAVLFDSGIRRGADVFKAVALGARCVLLGRPYAYGLAVGGEQGVHDVLVEFDCGHRPDARPGRLRLIRRGRSGQPGGIELTRLTS